MAIPKAFGEEINQPLPGWSLEAFKGFISLDVWREGRREPAFRVGAELEPDAGKVSRIVVDERVDNNWTSVVDEGLAGRLHDSIEQPAELFVHELSEVLEVVLPIALHDLQNDDAESASVVEASDRGARKVAAGALVGDLVHHGLHPLEGLVPIDELGLPNYSAQQFVAAEVGWLRSRVRESHLAVELVQPYLG